MGDKNRLVEAGKPKVMKPHSRCSAHHPQLTEMQFVAGLGG
jgi:hypothetical protein